MTEDARRDVCHWGNEIKRPIKGILHGKEGVLLQTEVEASKKTHRHIGRQTATKVKGKQVQLMLMIHEWEFQGGENVNVDPEN